MKQLLILSGKGGTGKTTVVGAFIKLNNSKAYADCDVDAPNLHLIAKHIICLYKKIITDCLKRISIKFMYGMRFVSEMLQIWSNSL